LSPSLQARATKIAQTDSVAVALKFVEAKQAKQGGMGIDLALKAHAVELGQLTLSQ